MMLSRHMMKVVIGAGGFAVLFYLARRGHLGAKAQEYAIDVSTRTVITGVNF